MGEDRLRPFDAETLRMIESITGKVCDVTMGKETYSIKIDCTDYNTPQYHKAIIGAIEGRMGKRIKSIKEHSDIAQIDVTIIYEDAKSPQGYKYPKTTPRLQVGDKYAKELVWAVKVEDTVENADKLATFTGGGEIELSTNKPAKWTFIDPISGILKYAQQGQYIIYTQHGFEVMDEKDFKNIWFPIH